MDHDELIKELPIIVEKLTPAERIQLAKERRHIQLLRFVERDRSDPAPLTRNQRLRFRPEYALLDATSRNDFEEVEKLLMEGAFPNSHNEDGLTPLHQCAIDNNEQILLLLLKYGADVNSQDTEQWTPLHAAACCAHKNIVRHLIDNGANLMAVNADGNMPYDICDDDDTLDLIETSMAAQGITQQMIDDERGAAERLMLADMKLLHQNQQPLDFRDEQGATALHVAAAHGYYDVAAFLLRCGVPPNVRDNDLWQPMHAAACWAQADIIELLCEYGGDINAKTATGETPLDLCEDDSTRAVISTLQAEAARKRRTAFGTRDSRRQSRKKKAFSKFESPQQPQSDSPFSARGAIRRLSLRDKSGISVGRIEAQKEGHELMRSMSVEDDLVNSGLDGQRATTSQSQDPNSLSPNDIIITTNGASVARHQSLPKQPQSSHKVKKGSQKSRVKAEQEWPPIAQAGARTGKGPAPLPTSPDVNARTPLNGGADSIAYYRQPKDTVIGNENVNDHVNSKCKCCTIM